jgi:hypothetical protein
MEVMMNLPFTAFWPKLTSRWFHFAAIPLFLISLPCLSSASVLEGKLRETMDDVTHNPSVTLNILQRESKAEREHQAIALKCGLYGFVSEVHLGPLKNVNPRVNIKLRFDEELLEVETWSWDPETAVAYSTSKNAFNRFFDTQTLHLELSASPDFMNSIEGNFQLSTIAEVIKEFEEKCDAIGWKATRS